MLNTIMLQILYVSMRLNSVVLAFVLTFKDMLMFSPLVCLQCEDGNQKFLWLQCIYLFIYLLFIFNIAMTFIFSIIPGLQCSVNFLLYSMVSQLHTHAYILSSHIILLHLK